MIGQNKIKEIKQSLVQNNNIPPLFIIVGEQKSGKKTAAEYIAEGLGEMVRCGNKVEEVREVINEAYKQSNQVFYLFSNIQTMSAFALNALLKIVEEPPFKAHFILTVNAEENCLSTLISRALKINIEPYKLEELEEYAKENKYQYSSEYLDIVYSPGLIKLTNEFDFMGMLCKIDQFIANPNYASAINLVSKVKLKEDDEGWDLDLFMSALYKECVAFYKKSQRITTDNINCISNLKFYLRYSVNKRLLIESFLFSLVGRK